MHKVVVGIFSNQASAARAVHEFRARGFSKQDVSVIPASDNTKAINAEVAEVMVLPSNAKGFGMIPMVTAVLGIILGFVFWQVVPGTYGHLVAIGGPLGFLYGAAVGVVLEAYVGPNFSKFRGEQDNSGMGRTLVTVHTDELLETYEAERLLEITGATEITTKVA